ncbi:MAG: hypothetical protein ABJJ53_16400 [Sulfitobacter sp.]
MLQTLVNTMPYAQPLSSIPTEGERVALPAKLFDGLVCLAPFVKRSGDQVEKWVHLINGKFYVVTNSLILEFAFGDNALPNLMFDPDIIRTLAAFDTAPQELVIGDNTFLFEWADGQELFMQGDAISGPVWFGGSKPMSDARAETVDKYWSFDDGKPVDDTARKTLRRALSAPKLHKDVYLTRKGLISRMRALKDVDGYTSEHLEPFETNATRMMRFELQAFARMIKVATQIDFQSSPVCFLHEGGRGLLVERSLGSDTPDVEVWND